METTTACRQTRSFKFQELTKPITLSCITWQPQHDLDSCVERALGSVLCTPSTGTFASVRLRRYRPRVPETRGARACRATRAAVSSQHKHCIAELHPSTQVWLPFLTHWCRRKKGFHRMRQRLRTRLSLFLSIFN